MTFRSDLRYNNVLGSTSREIERTTYRESIVRIPWIRNQTFVRNVNNPKASISFGRLATIDLPTLSDRIVTFQAVVSETIYTEKGRIDSRRVIFNPYNVSVVHPGT